MSVSVREAAPPKVDSGHARVVTRKPIGTPTVIRRRARRLKVVDIVMGIGLPIALLALWEGAAQWNWIDKRLYPAPTTVFDTMGTLIDNGVLGTAAGKTFKLLIQGFALGSSTGFLIGAMMGLSRRIRALMKPLLDALYVVPKLALFPIFLTMFGFKDAPKVVLVGVVVFFFVWINTMETFATVPIGYHEVADSFASSRILKFRQVLLPCALPQVLVGLRIAMGVSVLSIISAEFLIGGTGLGFLIFNSRQLFFQDQMFAGIITVAIIGVVLAAIVEIIGRWMTPWARRTSGGSALVGTGT